MTDPTDQSVWEGVMQIPDEELWRAHERCRERLVGWARQTLREQLTKRGASYDDVAMADQVLDPEALTIGFARRFATYKRGALLLRDPDRLRALLEDTKRPIQFVFAGKAHPADHEGKELIKAIVNFARDPAVRRRMVFIENYDMNVARYLVQGVDVWLNTPRRAVRSQRHQRHEGRRQRRAELLDPRRLVGRRLQPRRRLGDRPRRELLRRRTTRTRSRARRSTTSSRSRSSRCSTSAASTTSRASGSRG